MKISILQIAVFLMVFLSLSACKKLPEPLTADEMLDLGEKYLVELDYEQALVQFLKVIEIEPMNPRGYIGAAEAYSALGKSKEAIDILNKGLTALPNNSDIRANLEKLLPPPEPSEATSVAEPEPFPDMQHFLRDLLADYETKGYESIYDAFVSGEYEELMLPEEYGFPVIYLDDTGSYGIGLYQPDNDRSYIYVGDYADTKRSGHGFWIMMGDPKESQYRFEGAWEKDLPNGAGTSYYSYVHSQLQETIEATGTGTLIDGLWDGKVSHTDSYLSAHNPSHGGDYITAFYTRGRIVSLGEPSTNADGELAYKTGYWGEDESDVVWSENAEGLVRTVGISGCY